MTSRSVKGIGRALGAVLCFALIGCETGGDGSRQDRSATGVWNFVDLSGNDETMHLTQSGVRVAGHTERGGEASGIAEGTAFSIAIAYPHDYTLSLNVTRSGNRMAGTATDSADRTGSVTVTRLADNDGSEPDYNVIGTWFGSGILRSTAGNTVNDRYLEISLALGPNGTATRHTYVPATDDVTDDEVQYTVTGDFILVTQSPNSFYMQGTVSADTMRLAGATADGRQIRDVVLTLRVRFGELASRNLDPLVLPLSSASLPDSPGVHQCPFARL
jgi:hypothetical protein